MAAALVFGVMAVLVCLDLAEWAETRGSDGHGLASRGRKDRRGKTGGV